MHSAAGLSMSRHLHASPTWEPGLVAVATTKVPVMVAVERVPVADWAVSRVGCGRPTSSAILGFARVTIAEGSTIHGDGTMLLRPLPSLGYGHEADRAKKTSSPRCLRPRHGARLDLHLHHSR